MNPETYRRDFFDVHLSVQPFVNLSPNQRVALGTIDRGMVDIRRSIESFQESCAEAIERYAQSNDEAAQSLAQEIAWQGEQDRQTMIAAAAGVASAVEHARVYLGAQLAEVQWAVERNTDVARSILDALWKTHSIDSRQHYDEGVHWYESGERELAKGCFDKAVKACTTNAFAYQYLGFIAVHEGDAKAAIRSFDLTSKCAENTDFKAAAFYHLSRALYAADDNGGALAKIRTAVSLNDRDLIYKFELVRALMRCSLVREALQELENLIALDWRYWTAAAIDKTLEPMRAEIILLLARLRSEARTSAEKAIENFEETFRKLDSLPLPLSFAYNRSRQAKDEAQSFVRPRTNSGTFFAYKEVAAKIPKIHQSLVLEILNGYRYSIAAAQQKVRKVEEDNKAHAATIQQTLTQLQQELASLQGDVNWQISKLNSREKIHDGGYLFAWGCSGCVSVVGVMSLLGFLFLYFANARGADLRRFVTSLMTHNPLAVVLVLAFPVVVILRKIVFHGKRERVQLDAGLKRRAIQGRMAAAAREVSEIERRGAELLQREQAQCDKDRVEFEAAVSMLEQRLAVASA